MKRLHIALASADITATVADYTARLGCAPVVVIADEYALWRTDGLNLSVRRDANCRPGELRHLGFEDPAASEFTATTDVNGIVWERFTAELQAAEIEAAWPGSGYRVRDASA